MILKVFSSSMKLVPISWELLKVQMDAYLHVQAPKILSQSGPCFSLLLLQFLQLIDDSEEAGFKPGFKSADSLTAVSCV